METGNQMLFRTRNPRTNPGTIPQACAVRSVIASSGITDHNHGDDYKFLFFEKQITAHILLVASYSHTAMEAVPSPPLQAGGHTPCTNLVSFSSSTGERALVEQV